MHWTLTINDRATGWLTEAFHYHWRLCLLHTCARHDLLCPVYVLMPDHIHLIGLGFRDNSDQRGAIKFIRKNLRPALLPATWQKQAHDHVIGPKGCQREALIWTANYIFENPVRAGLVPIGINYPYLGCCLPGYPEMDVRAPDYWDRFWRIHNYLLNAQTTRWRSS